MTSPRRVAAALLAAGALAALAVAAPSTAVHATGAVTTSTNPGTALAVTLDALTPVAPQPGQTLTVSGSVTNTTSTTVTNVAVGLRLGPAVATRSDFEAYGATPQAALPADLGEIGSIRTLAGNLAAHDSVTFTLKVPVDDLDLPAAWQVYELGIQASASDTDASTVLGQLRTYLPWAPRHAAGVGSPVSVAWLWPLVDRPRVDADGDWLNDDLAGSLTPTGRLGRLVSAAELAETQATPAGHGRPAVADVPVTWAVDPMLVADASAMVGGYRVVTGSGTVAGTGAAVARLWLGSLRTAVSGHPLVALPYADPDVVAATRAGLDRVIGAATASGRQVIARDLPGADALDAAWPPGGAVDEHAADVLFGAGDTTLVLSDSSLPLAAGSASATPTGHAVLHTDDGEIQALLTDSGLSYDVQSGSSDRAEDPLWLQRYLAETLMIQAEAPSTPRSVIVAPAQRWRPSGSFARAVLSDTGRVPWITPTTLSAIRDQPVPSGVHRGSLTYSSAARSAELPASYLHQVQRLQTDVSDFADVLPAGADEAQAYGRSVQECLSSAWRDAADPDRLVSDDQREVTAAMAQVRITSAAGSFVTLTSHEGSVPVTISNNLSVPVTVKLQVEANQRLALQGSGQVVKSIPAHQQKLVEVKAQAKTSGVFPLEVRLLTPTGRTYGPAVQINVRSTVYGTITLVITGAATAALLLTVGVRLVRRARRSRRGGSTATPA